MPVPCAEELLILLINFMKKINLEQIVLPTPCLEEEEEEEEAEEEEEEEDKSESSL
jgi:hypothetical protein